MSKWEYINVVEWYRQGDESLGDKCVAVDIVDVAKHNPGIEYDSKEDSIHTIMHLLGDNGWEMCGATSRAGDTVVKVDYFFKRPAKGDNK